MENGQAVALKPHSDRVYYSLWGNGATLEFLVYKEQQPGEDNSDRIHMIVTPANGTSRGWLMNVEDATAIIRGLATSIQHALDMPGVPVMPKQSYENE